MKAVQSGSCSSSSASGCPAEWLSSATSAPSAFSTGYVERACPSSSCAIAAAATADSSVGALIAHSA